MSERHFRCDSYPIKYYEMTPEGFLSFIAPIAKVGKMTYFDSVNNIFYDEYVPKETLVSSAKTFRRKPLTFHHPDSGKVTSYNFSKYLKGVHGDRDYFDDATGLHWFSGTVFDSESIDSIKNGNAKELSCGYDGYIKLDAQGNRIQIQRIGNHSAITPRGRAGRDVSFRVDSEDVPSPESSQEYAWILKEDSDLIVPEPPEVFVAAIHSDSGFQYFFMPKTNKADTDTDTKVDTKETNIKTMKQILLGKKIFNVDGDDATALAEAIHELEANNEELLNTSATAMSEKDGLQSRLTALETELANVKGQLTAKETQLTEVASKSDSADTIAIEIKSRLDAWSKVEPFITKVQPTFKRDENLELNVPEIERLYLGIRYPNLKAHYDSYDLADAVKAAEVHGAFMASMDATSVKTEPTHSDVVIGALTKSDSVTTSGNDSGGVPELPSDPMKITNEDSTANLNYHRARVAKEIEERSKAKRNRKSAS